MKVKNSQQSAFTLIELLVVISIMLIFIGSTIAQYNTYTEQVKLKNDGKKLVDILELAKKKALSSDLIVTPFVTPPTYCTNFTGYQLTLNANSYSLIYCCNSICSTNINTYNFNNTNIFIISPALLPTNLNFPPLMSGVNLTVRSIRLKNSSISTTNKCIDISISAIGVVELNETLITCL